MRYHILKWPSSSSYSTEPPNRYTPPPPRSQGRSAWMMGFSGERTGTVELPYDVFEGIDDVIVEEQLLRGADVDWRCH